MNACPSSLQSAAERRGKEQAAIKHAKETVKQQRRAKQEAASASKAEAAAAKGADAGAAEAEAEAEEELDLLPDDVIEAMADPNRCGGRERSELLSPAARVGSSRAAPLALPGCQGPAGAGAAARLRAAQELPAGRRGQEPEGAARGGAAPRGPRHRGGPEARGGQADVRQVAVVFQG